MYQYSLKRIKKRSVGSPLQYEIRQDLSKIIQKLNSYPFTQAGLPHTIATLRSPLSNRLKYFDAFVVAIA